MSKEYCWSIENGTNDGGVENSIKKCIAEAKATYPDAKEVYIGEYKEHKPYLLGEDIIEQLQEQAYYESYGISDDYGWLDDLTAEATEELEKEINRVVKKILKKYKQKPNFGTFKNQKKHKI